MNCSIQHFDYNFSVDKKIETVEEALELFDSIDWEKELLQLKDDGDCPPGFYLSDSERLHVYQTDPGVWSILYAYPLIKNILWLIPFETEREYTQVFSEINDVREAIRLFGSGDRLMLREIMVDPA